MGTVLSFSPRERRPIYTTHHHGSGTISTSNSTSDFPLNNYAYEQMNNAKNRENSRPPPPMQYLTVPNAFPGMIQNGGGGGNNLVLFSSSNSNIMNNNHNNNNNINLSSSTTSSAMEERAADSARILSEKNAIEKNLKKHSLFINALSWKRLSSSHGKKKLDANNVKNNNNNKSGGNNNNALTTSSFRPPTLTDTVHPMVMVNDKKKYQQQQIQLVSSNHHHQQQPIQQPLQNQTLFYAPGGDPKSLLALDLERAANNASNLHHNPQHIEKVMPKMSIPVRPIQLTKQTSNIDQQQQPQPAPRKTIIQVSFLLN